MPHRPLPKDANFPQLEEQILERWRERDIYNESMRRREGAKPFVFYEGPPTANGRPGSHHVLARVFKPVPALTDPSRDPIPLACCCVALLVASSRSRVTAGVTFRVMRYAWPTGGRASRRWG